ncbi:MAG: hypothetical protein JSS94_07465 [Bacteroidetes bacterium]|jgi:hypothetical protein|nr:hypothetical protein [Bacteroidota bacterium]
MGLDEIKKDEIRLIIKEKYQSASKWSETDYINLEKVFEKKLRNIYLEAQKIYYDVIENIQADDLRTEITALKKTLKKTYNSTKYKSFFDDLTIDGFTLTDKIEDLKADDRSVESFLNNGDIKGSTKDFYAVCIGRKGWKDFTSEINNNLENEYLNIPVSSFIDDPRQLKIAGAIIINQPFIESIKTLHFSMAEFYTAIQSENGLCQFYGIANHLDIERRYYRKLEQAVITSLNQKREYKICGIVHGTGGSGKSTVLRRLCVDIQKNENVTVVWITDVMQFFQYSIPTIKQDLETNNEKKYLIVIEDWYRMFHNDSEIGSELLKQLHKHNNVRIVIGDRTTVGKPYEYYGSDYNLLLSSNENREIIEQIIKKHPVWQEASDRLFESLKNDETTLFLLLFILARISQENSGNTSDNLSDPLVVFKNIIKSDLNFIAKQEEESYKGLAKALYYWACIYVEYKVLISYETFLKIADHYNGKKTSEIRDLFSLWNADEDILDRLKIYVNKSENGQIQFNHDILAEAISNINIDGWKKFGTKIKLDLLDVITEKGDDISASQFLYFMMFKDQNIFLLNREKKIFYIVNLIKKGNRHALYLSRLLEIIRTEKEQNQFAELLWEKEIYSSSFWRNFLSKTSNKEYWINKIFRFENVGKVDPATIKATFYYKYSEPLLKNYLEHFFEENNWKKYPINLIDIFNFFPDENIVQSIIKEILYDVEWKKREYYVISRALSTCNDAMLSQRFSDNILKNKNWLDYHPFLIATAIRYSSIEVQQNFIKSIFKKNFVEINIELLYESLYYSDDNLRRKFALKFLRDINWKETSHVIVPLAIKELSNNEKQNLFKGVLTSNNWMKINYTIIDFCLKDCENEIIKNQFLFKVLNSPFSKEIFETFFVALTHSKDEILKKDWCDNFLMKSACLNDHLQRGIIYKSLEISKDKKTALYYLKDWTENEFRYNVMDNMFLICLSCFENEINLPDEVKLIIKTIIDDFNNDFAKGTFFYYKGLMKLSFHNDFYWKNEVQHIIRKWRKYDRRIITNLLYSHLRYFDVIKRLCLHILIGYRREICKISFSEYSSKEYGGHVKIAFGHPDLRTQAKQIAFLIFSSQNIKAPECIKEISQQIVENDIYPEWKI